jgi:hypothetical protein
MLAVVFGPRPDLSATRTICHFDHQKKSFPFFLCSPQEFPAKRRSIPYKKFHKRRVLMTTRTNLFLLALLGILLTFSLAGCNSWNGAHTPTATPSPTSTATPSNLTLNPVLDFYINRTWDTDANSLYGYGTDSAGTYTDGSTGSQTGHTGDPGFNYQNYFKLLFNFNISSLSGATIQSAYFRIYLYNVAGADTPPNAVLENIFYGNTNSFPPAVRNYDNEFGGYIVSPTISATAAATAVGYIQIDVTAKLQADITAGRSNSQFRLSHANPASLLNFSCSWNMADSATNKPELVITYTP